MRTNTDFSNYIGHEVVDNKGNKVGSLECLWTDHTGQPAFLGIKTGWFIGRTHVVPAHSATVSERGRSIRVPYDAERVKNAPAYDGDVKLDDRTEREVCSYYGVPFEGEQETRPQTAAAGAGRERTSMALREEELKVGKREVEYGGIRLRKVIRTETVNQPVELKREEIVVERVPGRETAQAGKAFEQEEVYIPLRREEPVVQKEARVREEVRVSKRAETERQNVTEQVRKEDVQIDRSGTARRGRQPAAARETRPAGTRAEGRQTGGRARGDKAVFAIATSEQQASRIVDELKSGGFSKDDVSVIFADKRSSKEFAHEKNTKAPEGATTGAAAGGVLGGALGWLAGAGAIAIPGVGPLIAAGPIMAALSGAAVGAATGGIAGGLIGLGIPEYEAKRYENRVREGNILISVHSDSADETRRAKEIFERNGAEDIASAREDEVETKRS
jgi:uncharacterized protein (TIGR02271 family)